MRQHCNNHLQPARGRSSGRFRPRAASLWAPRGFLRLPWEDVQADTAPAGSPAQPELGYRTGFKDEYELRGRVGKGSVGEVYVAVHRQSGQEYAVKSMSKVRRRFTRVKTLEKIQRETTILKRLQACDYVVRLIDVFEDAEEVHVVQELCRGGDLMRFIEVHGRLDERNAAWVALQVLEFLHTCHQQNIMYGDIKPANICMPAPSAEPAAAQIRLVDFGNSVPCGQTQRLSKRRGTLTFLSPEAYDQNYGLKADVWALGVMLYWLFSCRFPFWGADAEPPVVSTVEDMARLVSTAPILYNYAPFTSMSAEGLDFLQSCLQRDEAARVSVAQALQHPWLQGARAQRLQQAQ